MTNEICPHHSFCFLLAKFSQLILISEDKTGKQEGGTWRAGNRGGWQRVKQMTVTLWQLEAILDLRPAPFLVKKDQTAETKLGQSPDCQLWLGRRHGGGCTGLTDPLLRAPSHCSCSTAAVILPSQLLSPVTLAYHLLICFLKKCFSKNWGDTDFNCEGNKENSAGFNEKVFIGFSKFLLTITFYQSRPEKSTAAIISWPVATSSPVTIQKFGVSWKIKRINKWLEETQAI